MILTRIVLLLLLGAEALGAPLVSRMVLKAETASRAYDVRFALTEPAANGGGLVFGFADAQNMLLLCLENGQARVHRCEAGRWSEIARGSLPPRVQPGAELTLSVRPGRVALVYESEIILLFYFSSPPIGRVGFAAPAEGSPPFTHLRLQEIGEIRCGDDFLGSDGKLPDWIAMEGEWRIDAPRDALVARDKGPPNSSRYRCSGKAEGLSVTGQEFWDDYAVSVAMQNPGSEPAGIVFRFRDPQNYGRFTLGKRGAMLEVVKNGKVILSREQFYEFAPETWYLLRAKVCDRFVRCYIGSKPVLEAEGEFPAEGKPGLYCAASGDAIFDDFEVTPWENIRDEFRQIAPGKWRICSGRWEQKDGQLVGKASSAAMLLTGRPDWPVGTVEAVLNHPEGMAGIVFGRQGEGVYHDLSLLGGKRRGMEVWQLARTRAGKREVLAAGEIAAAPRHILRVEHERGRILCFADGEALTRLYDFDCERGEIGLIVHEGRGEFARFEASPAETGARVRVFHTDFRADWVPGEKGQRHLLLGDLLRPAGPGWRIVTRQDKNGQLICEATETGSTVWFRDPVPGNASIRVHLGSRGAKKVSLFLAANPGKSEGYELQVEEQSASLLRNGETVASRALPTKLSNDTSIELQRDGNFLVGRVDDAALLWRDDSPLTGERLGIRVVDGTAAFEELSIQNHLGVGYRFDHVEPDWRPSSGRWVLHDGIACIPWDHWITAFGEPEAMLWNKHLFPPQTRITFYVSEGTEGYESGHHQHFPYHNIRVATSGDGRDWRSGYCFEIAGGPGKDLTRLFRKGVPVAETRAFRIVMGGHCNNPRAFQIGVVRAGNRIALTIDGRELLSYTDPQPLGGGQVGFGCVGCRADFKDFLALVENPWESPELPSAW